MNKLLACIVFGLSVIAGIPVANAEPVTECTSEQPYPNYPNRICVRYGQSCSIWVCDNPIGIPGTWGSDGIYTPDQGQ